MEFTHIDLCLADQAQDGVELREGDLSVRQAEERSESRLRADVRQSTVRPDDTTGATAPHMLSALTRALALD